ncbi:MAG: hypothetical protein ACMUEL_02180 [Flavobacteriales bacterium Tduv]
MLRSTAQIRFSDLYIDRSTRRSEFFKRLNTLIHWEDMEKEIRKIYQKVQGIKATCLQWNILIYDDAFD